MELFLDISEQPGIAFCEFHETIEHKRKNKAKMDKKNDVLLYFISLLIYPDAL